jgi:hypothetical protein
MNPNQIVKKILGDRKSRNLLYLHPSHPNKNQLRQMMVDEYPDLKDNDINKMSRNDMISMLNDAGIKVE